MTSVVDPAPDTPVVVMGVSGSGKTTMGSALAERWGRTFVDADDLHPAANKAKMASGVPLDDDDRAPWLAVVSARLNADDRGTVPVIACSALKKKYRDMLRASAPRTLFVHLDVDADTLGDRVSSRAHEYMPPSLLKSQLATLETLLPAERGVTVNAAAPVEELLETIDAAMTSRVEAERTS
ncbi:MULTISPECIES: gluconokinase [Microbacterium]|uniref:gluconokinase n=1 Tax=Microbacterium TaxID=33882 RepID=UPI002786523D|nr:MULTISPECIES: gluconokinase [Microbacterium]MDQ1082728.1 gluconokinase [Microbacterium sp. SORGH_AS_0344]MDQ1168501.1 gluconokinase [Microbacterium proteolyticum]